MYHIDDGSDAIVILDDADFCALPSCDDGALTGGARHGIATRAARCPFPSRASRPYVSPAAVGVRLASRRPRRTGGPAPPLCIAFDPPAFVRGLNHNQMKRDDEDDDDDDDHTYSLRVLREGSTMESSDSTRFSHVVPDTCTADKAPSRSATTSGSVDNDYGADDAGDFTACALCDGAAGTYLSEHGITAETAAAFRVGHVAPAALVRLGLIGRRAPAAGGVSIPTWLPACPQRVAGLVRLTPAQNKHAFATAPQGIAGPIAVATAARVVLTDNPLLAMRLHQDGVEHVALVEDVAVLVPLAEWLRERDLVLVAHRQPQMAMMRKALGSRGVDVPGVLVSTAAGRFSPEVQATLGLTRHLVDEAPPITPLVLTQLHAYARSRVEAGDAEQALARLGLNIPDLVTSYRIGFLPADYQRAVPRDLQRALVGRRCGNAVMIPAYDEDGVMVDAAVLRLHASSSSCDGFWSQPRGLLAPELACGHTDLIITDTVTWLARLFEQGYRHVLLVRGVEDARQQVVRLLRAGVERVTLCVRRDADGMMAMFQAGGLSASIRRPPTAQDVAAATVSVPVSVSVSASAPVSAPVPVSVPVSAPVLACDVAQVIAHEAEVSRDVPMAAVPTAENPRGMESLSFVEEDSAAAVIIFQAGPIRYAVERRDDGDTRRRVVIRSNGQSSQDRFDLASEAQRQRYAGNATRRIGQSAAVIVAHLAALLPMVQEWEDARDRTPVVALTTEGQAAGLSLLEDPNLLDRVVADLTALGWIGEDKAKRALYLASISRLLPQPVWALYRAGAGAAPWQGVSCIAALTPPDACTVFHHLTEMALRHADGAHLRHRLVIVDQAEALRPESALALRILHERGGISWAAATAAVAPGVPGARGEARGPVAVLAAAAGALDHRCRDVFLAITADESPAQTAAILADQRRRLALGEPVGAGAAAIMARHHAAQRLLERHPVRIPFADRIIFPASRLRHRDEQAWFLGLVAASALLHQRQRVREAGAILASEADFAAVVACTAGLIGTEAAGISAAARGLLAALYERNLVTFTMADLGGLFPEWTRYAFRAALQDLLDFGYVESPHGGRGRLRAFRLAARAAGSVTSLTGIRLRPADVASITEAEARAVSRGELATVGEPGVANFIPRLTGT